MTGCLHVQNRSLTFNPTENHPYFEKNPICGLGSGTEHAVKKMLYNKCEHEWVRDWDDRGSRSSWICKHCDLYRNPNYNY